MVLCNFVIFIFSPVLQGVSILHTDIRGWSVVRGPQTTVGGQNRRFQVISVVISSEPLLLLCGVMKYLVEIMKYEYEVGFPVTLKMIHLE